jgi:hypothetical protein
MIPLHLKKVIAIREWGRVLERVREFVSRYKWVCCWRGGPGGAQVRE